MLARLRVTMRATSVPAPPLAAGVLACAGIILVPTAGAILMSASFAPGSALSMAKARVLDWWLRPGGEHARTDRR